MGVSRGIPITPHIHLDASELEERFIRAPGPGGQKVNKVATAVQLRFDVKCSPSLPSSVKQRLVRLADRRIGGSRPCPTSENTADRTPKTHRCSQPTNAHVCAKQRAT